jgi:rfaE bifunctional protein kinase chain/domain
MKMALPKIRRILRAMNYRRIGVVGDLMLDRYVWGTASRLSPEAAVPVVDFVEENAVPGGAGNVAANLAALGARVAAFGIAGEDDAGKSLRERLRASGVPEKGIVAAPGRQTTVKTRIIARHQQVVRVDRETRAPLDEATQERLIRRVIGHLRSLDALVISDYDKGVVTDGLAERVLGACHRLRLPVFVKPKTSRLFVYRGATAIVCNRKEAGFFLTRALDDDAALEEAGRALLAHFGCSAVLITLGENGMCLVEDGHSGAQHLPATSFEVTYRRVGLPGVEHGASGRQVFDVTGAGDTVLATLALARAAGASLREAAWLANTAAGVVVGKLGTACVTPQELLGAARDFARKN